MLSARNIATAVIGGMVVLQFVASTVTDLILGAIAVATIWVVTGMTERAPKD